ncbi:unnamed protein product [Chondrus crispus]|uniref:Uncharacterized protein n=1 Tax=Chondrus crispus TaxID=2769 RepID=R7Q5A6_CHOCR|nr:unnamed protein product [Chondrus crispus]CDF32541.1 unnamed protein product [Chondrus crispus]|eukprot:XP_005712207.1 unnamed protein product [Chondrus crispus]
MTVLLFIATEFSTSHPPYPIALLLATNSLSSRPYLRLRLLFPLLLLLHFSALSPALTAFQSHSALPSQSPKPHPQWPLSPPSSLVVWPWPRAPLARRFSRAPPRAPISASSPAQYAPPASPSPCRPPQPTARCIGCSTSRSPPQSSSPSTSGSTVSTSSAPSLAPSTQISQTLPTSRPGTTMAPPPTRPPVRTRRSSSSPASSTRTPSVAATTSSFCAIHTLQMACPCPPTPAPLAIRSWTTRRASPLGSAWNRSTFSSTPRRAGRSAFQSIASLLPKGPTIAVLALRTPLAVRSLTPPGAHNCTRA